MTTPKGIDREKLTTKLLGFIRRVDADVQGDSLVHETKRFAASLGDEELRTLVRVAGVSCRDADHRQYRGQQNLDFIFKSILSEETGQLLLVLSHSDLIGRDSALSELCSILILMEDFGHDPTTDIKRLRAHMAANERHEPKWGDEFWVYSSNRPLARLVDNHPDHVDAIFTLRNERDISNITEEMLNDFIGITGSVNDGWL